VDDPSRAARAAAILTLVGALNLPIIKFSVDWWNTLHQPASVLVLFLIYCGILSLWRTIEEPNQAARAVAILTLVGAVNVPIVKFSVDWWNTLHQPASVLRAGGPAIDPSMLYPLLAMAAAFTVLGLALHVAGMRTEILRRRVRTATILEAERLDAAA